MVKKSVLEPEMGGESLSSYQCKTCVLYACEMTPPSAWTQEILISCLIQCLKLMLRWVAGRCCPSFFIKDQNLFKKEGFYGMRTRLHTVLQSLLDSGHRFLYNIQNDNIKWLLQGGGGFKRQIYELNVNRHFLDLKVRCAHAIISHHAFFKKPGDVTDFLLAALDFFQNADNMSDHTPEEFRSAVEHIQPWLHLRLAMGFACRAFNAATQEDRNKMTEQSDQHFNMASNTDAVSVRLARAAIHYRAENLDKCITILRDVEQSWPRHFIALCPCRELTHHDNKEQNIKCLNIRDLSLPELMSSHIVSCMIILPSMTELAPYALKYEMFRSLDAPPNTRQEPLDFWYDWAVVDPKVFLYFMQYLVCKRLDREADKQTVIDNLRVLIRYGWLAHRETAFNLLGWIYGHEQRIEEAKACLRQSWLIEQHHNAVGVHMQLLS